ncbi:hypothetical protein [Klebsiella pasteurii]|nr:hypothetical protein [Klebsiella pasteurii]HBC9240722.1 hypothetical protein [Klebsiella oxytoca]MDD9666141.1 hypothetical protein [Klebsiella pasteurii]MDD9671749.1 hypothetical protein [Klebsiella pasteurii]MDD9687807.1 hypothetical protein [Klebsiella pasteurii]HEC2026932.1 hypothetical protein [Klebsiella oxytoca]
MLRRLCLRVLFAVLLFVGWRLAGMLMDSVMIIVILAFFLNRLSAWKRRG